MNKGVSPVIASILIILVAVSMASAYIVFTDRIFGGVTEEGEETVSRTTQELFSDFTISSASGQRVFIKNTGTSELSASALDVFMDDEPIEYAADFDTLEEDELGALTLRGLWKHGPGTHSLRISAGSFQDTAGIRASPDSSIVGDWRFEEGEGTTAHDSSGNGNDGKLMDDLTECECPTWTTDTHHSSSEFAIRFDGDENEIHVPDSTSLRAPNGITVEAWVKADNDQTAGTPRIMDKVFTTSSVGTEYRLFIDSSPPYNILWDVHRDDVINRTRIDDTLTADEWHHVVAYFDTSTGTGRIYMDSELEVEEDFIDGPEIKTNTNNLIIADNEDGGGGDDHAHLKGVLDSIRIYSQALEPGQLYSLSLS